MHIIKAEKLVKRYKDGHLALDSLNIAINKKTTVIIGRNGAGKTNIPKRTEGQGELWQNHNQVSNF